jgi:hypothetical protein
LRSFDVSVFKKTNLAGAIRYEGGVQATEAAAKKLGLKPCEGAADLASASQRMEGMGKST